MGQPDFQLLPLLVSCQCLRHRCLSCGVPPGWDGGSPSRLDLQSFSTAWKEKPMVSGEVSLKILTGISMTACETTVHIEACKAQGEDRAQVLPAGQGVVLIVADGAGGRAGGAQAAD